jgi:hypothetical protein
VRSKPLQVGILTRSSPKVGRYAQRFPVAESVLDGAKTQSHIHDCTVGIDDGPNTYVFRVFFKRHRYLPLNKAVPVLHPCGCQPHGNCQLRGDVVVMRVAADGRGVVNMRGLDTVLADWMIKRYVVNVVLSNECS